MSFFSWFSNSKSPEINIKVSQTDKGSHGIHWSSIFDKQLDTQIVMNRFFKTIEFGDQKVLNESLVVVTDKLMRGIIHNNRVITGFPYIKGIKSEIFKSNSIVEWSHAQNLEAIVSVSHVSGCGLNFFATDYAINKNIYKTQQDLSLSIIGLIYDLEAFNVDEWNKETDKLSFSEDFCGYFPKSEDEIEFIGRIQHMKDYSLDDILGYLITVGVTPDFSMDFFIARTNLSIEIEVNKAVRGFAWIQGTLEK